MVKKIKNLFMVMKKIKICALYLTFGNVENAENVITFLLERELIACANIIRNITSFFEWEGKIQKNEEVLVFIKTSESNYDEVVNAVKDLHQYDLPCILKMPISDGDSDFVNWVLEQCK